jgi:hypothetical protein
MAAMHAIEITDGEYRGRRRPLGNTAKNQHGLGAAGKAGDYINLETSFSHRGHRVHRGKPAIAIGVQDTRRVKCRGC